MKDEFFGKFLIRKLSFLQYFCHAPNSEIMAEVSFYLCNVKFFFSWLAGPELKKKTFKILIK